MRNLFVVLVIASLLFLSSTFAGISVFGMQTVMNDVDCINHCIAIASSLTNAVIPSIEVVCFVFLLFVAVLFFEQLGITSLLARVHHRWREREGIG